MIGTLLITPAVLLRMQLLHGVLSLPLSLPALRAAARPRHAWPALAQDNPRHNG